MLPILVEEIIGTPLTLFDPVNASTEDCSVVDLCKMVTKLIMEVSYVVPSWIRTWFGASSMFGSGDPTFERALGCMAFLALEDGMVTGSHPVQGFDSVPLR